MQLVTFMGLSLIVALYIITNLFTPLLENKIKSMTATILSLITILVSVLFIFNTVGYMLGFGE